MHQQIRHGVSIQHDCKYPLHRFHLGFVRPLLELGFQLLLRWQVRCIVLVHQTVGILEDRHDGERMEAVTIEASGNVRSCCTQASRGEVWWKASVLTAGLAKNPPFFVN
jgi:hypothetical protein